MANTEYKVYQYDSEVSDLDEFEELMSKIYSSDNIELVQMKDAISPTGKYTAVVHYIIETASEDEPEEPRISEGAEL